MVKLGFVILNYNTSKETEECIISIQRLIDIPKEEYIVAVVDNGSEHESVDRLKSVYSTEGNIIFIENGSNLGFACGNNVGIRFLNDNYAPEFIVVLNSDTELIQNNLYENVLTEFQRSKFALLGPMMITADGRCNDSPWKPSDYEKVKSKLRELKCKQAYYNIHLEVLWKLYNWVMEHISKNDKSIHESDTFWEYHKQVELQGAFLIFSKEAFKCINGFDDRTFLYYEEQILYQMLVKQNQTIVYTPQIIVFHKEGKSTKKIKRNREKAIFLNDCNIKSLSVLLSMMEEG